MFNASTSFLHDNIPLTSALIVLSILFGAFVCKAIIVYTLKHKYSLIETSYKVNGIKFSYEYLKMQNVKKPILITNYKILYLKKRNIILNKKIANSTSVWSQLLSLFISEKNIQENKWIFIYEKSLWFVQLISIVFTFIHVEPLQYVGLGILCLTLIISMILNFQSSKISNNIFKNIKKFMNDEDLKQMKKLFKYFRLFYSYHWFMALPFLFNDIFYFIKNNGIGR